MKLQAHILVLIRSRSFQRCVGAKAEYLDFAKPPLFKIAFLTRIIKLLSLGPLLLPQDTAQQKG